MTQPSSTTPWGCLSISALAILAVLLSLTNPDMSSHKARFKEEVNATVNQSIAKGGLVEGAMLWLARDATVEMVTDRLTYENLLICSRTKLDGEPATFGICGQVFVIGTRQP